jgi:hypothetical protein
MLEKRFMDNFEDFVEKVRDANPIEDVISALGFPLRLRGGRADGDRDDCNTLHVLIRMQHAWWYGDSGWHGDVFAFVQKVKGGDFMQALEYLADRAGIRMPEFKKEDAGEVQKRAATVSAFVVAAGVFHRWLMAPLPSASPQINPQRTGAGEHDLGGEACDAKALAYVRGRGWTDDTTRAAMTGFSGRKEKWQIADMRGEFSLFGIDPLSPAAVAITGFEGDVMEWANKYDLLNHPDFDKDWIEKKRVSGLMSTPGVIYTHQRFGKVDYLSRRQLPGFDVFKDFKSGKERAWKSYNPHKCLVGPKQIYYNHVYDAGKACVMCEGQGDAITWGQWSYGGLALLGMFSDFERKSAEEQEPIIRWVKKMWKHDGLFYAPDDDEAGEKNVRVIGKVFGPKIQIVRMSRLLSRPPLASPLPPNSESTNLGEESTEVIHAEA